MHKGPLHSGDSTKYGQSELSTLSYGGEGCSNCTVFLHIDIFSTEELRGHEKIYLEVANNFANTVK